MDKILRVARREYVETVRTRTFIFGLIFAPVLMITMMIFAGRIGPTMPEPRQQKTVVITDLTGELADELTSVFQAHNASTSRVRFTLSLDQAGPDSTQADRDRRKEDVEQGLADAYAVIAGDSLDAAGSLRLYTRKAQAADTRWAGVLADLVNRAAFNRRWQRRDLSPELLAHLRRRVPMEQIIVTGQGDEARDERGKTRMFVLMMPFVFTFLMFLGVITTGQYMLTSIIEEKNSRVIEVLLSALSPWELMVGKIVGLTGVGLTVVTVWAVTGYVAASSQGLQWTIDPQVAVYFVIYYLLGFLLFSSILAGIGSICNTIKETQSLMMPVTMTMVLPMVACPYLTQNPEGTLARALSLFPPTTPTVMILRLSTGWGVGPGEIVISIVLLAGSVLAVMWAAATIFRTGILLYGKRPGLREVSRWLRQG